jgi:hypothetical protein
LCLEVRTLEPRGKGVIFTKTKWYRQGSISREKVLNLLSYEFFESAGIPLVSESYWVGVPVQEKPQQPKIHKNLEGVRPQGEHFQKPVRRQHIAVPQAAVDAELDQILDNALEETDLEEGETIGDRDGFQVTEGQPPVRDFMDMMNLAGQIPDQSLQGMMSAFATPGGLAQMGNLLQNPGFLGFISPVMTAMMANMPKPPNSGSKEEKGDEELTEQPLDPAELPVAEEV